MKRRQLPVGIHSFATLRAEDYYYVDKTAQISHLVSKGQRYYLSRPRCFGKSLLLDTLRELFEGNEGLFHGLAIHQHWDWSVNYPVVHLSFDSGKYCEPGGLNQSIARQLMENENSAGLEPSPEQHSGPERLSSLIKNLHRKTDQQVVVLVDGCDKPILDVMNNRELLNANLKDLSSLYSIIKHNDRLIHFVFISGISMFSGDSFFPELNHLENISFDQNYGTICGYTDKDLDTVFAPELLWLDRDEIRRWYNGYNWREQEKVYNPLDILMLLQKRIFKPYWFESGSSTNLLTFMMEGNIGLLDIEKPRASQSQLSTLDINEPDSISSLFQAGYLTIAGEEQISSKKHYILDYPNFEVRDCLTRRFFEFIEQPSSDISDHGQAFAPLLASNDFQGLAVKLGSFLAGIPCQWHGQNARLESWYATNLFGCLRIVGLDVRVEDPSRRERADMIVFHEDQVFIFELKMADTLGLEKTADKAIMQIRHRGFVDKYQHLNLPIHLIGIAFDREEITGVSLFLKAEPA